MTSKKSVILSLAVVLWLSVFNIQISCSTNTTVPSSRTFNVSTQAFTSPIPSPSVVSYNLSNISHNHSTISTPVIITSSVELTSVTLSMDAPYSSNSTSSIHPSFNTTATTTVASNYTNAPNATSSLSSFGSASHTASNLTTASSSVLSTVRSEHSSANMSSTSSHYPVYFVDSTITTTPHVSNFTSTIITSMAYVIGPTTSSSLLQKESSILATSSSVNHSQSIGSAESSLSEKYLSTLTSGNVQTSSTVGDALSTRNSTLVVQISSSSLIAASSVDDSMMISTVSSLSSTYSSNATQEAVQTSVKPSPMSTTQVSNSTTHSILNSSKFKTQTPSASHRPSSTFLLPSPSQTSIPNVTTGITLNSTQVDTGDPSPSYSPASLSLMPSPTSTLNVTNQQSSQTDDFKVVSYTTPCYITYVITQIINETSLGPTTVAMETSVSSVLSKSKLQGVTKTPVVTIATSRVSMAWNVTSSSRSVVMETSVSSVLSKSKLQGVTKTPVVTIATSTESMAWNLTSSSWSVAMETTLSSSSSSPFPQLSSLFLSPSASSSSSSPPISSSSPSSLSSPSLSSLSSSSPSSSPSSPSSSSLSSSLSSSSSSSSMSEMVNTTSRLVIQQSSSVLQTGNSSSIKVTVTQITANTTSLTPAASTVNISSVGISYSTITPTTSTVEASIIPGNTSHNSTVTHSASTVTSTHSFSVEPTRITNTNVTTTLGNVSDSMSAALSAPSEPTKTVNFVSKTTTASIQMSSLIPNVTATSSYTMYNTISTGGTNVSGVQTSSIYTVNTSAADVTAISPSMTVPSPGLISTLGTPTLPNNTKGLPSNTVDTVSTANNSLSAPTPSSVLNSTSPTPTAGPAKRRRRREVGVRLDSSNSSSSSRNESDASYSSYATTLTTSLLPLLPSLLPSSSSSSPSSIPGISTSDINATITTGQPNGPTVTMATTSNTTSTTVGMTTTASTSSVLPMPTTSSPINESAMALVSTTSVSISSEAANITYRVSATLTTVSIPTVFLNSSSNILLTLSTSNVAGASLVNTGNMPTATLASSVSTTASKLTPTSFGINYTSILSSRSFNSNDSSTAPPITVVMTPTVAMPTSETSTSRMNNTEVSHTVVMPMSVNSTSYLNSTEVSQTVVMPTSVISTSYPNNTEVSHTVVMPESVNSTSYLNNTEVSHTVVMPMSVNSTSYLNSTEVSQTVVMPTSVISTSYRNNTEVSHTVVMPMSVNSTSYRNNTEVSQTVVMPTLLASKSRDVTSTSSDVKVSKSQVANTTSTSPIFIPTLTPTSIHPTPLLTSPNPPQTSDVTSSIESSSHRKNILLTTSSLGICYVVYTTRVMHSSIVPTPSLVTRLNQTTAYGTSSQSISNTSIMTFSSIAPLKSLVLEMNSTLVQTDITTAAVTVTTSSLIINSTSAPVTSQHISSSSPVNATPVLNSTQTTGFVSKSIAVNTTSLSPIATVVSSVVSMATINSTVYPSTTSLSAIGGVTSSAMINSSSDVSPHPSTSLFNVTASQASSTPMLTSTSISPSMSAIVMTTSSVVTTPLTTTTARPTTAPIPDNSTLIKTTLQIPRDVDVNTEDVRRNVSTVLEETYNSASAARRKRRATDGTEAKIYNITRQNPPSTDAVVLFSIVRNGNTLSAVEAVAVYDKITNLSSIGVWKVISRPEPFVTPTPPPQSVLVSMIFERINRNLSVPSNKKAMEERLASYYKKEKGTAATVTATIHVILLEKTQNVYVQFYITEDGKQVPAATVVKVFDVEHVTQLTAHLQEQVIVGPYTDESLRGEQTDYIITRIAASPSKMQDPDFNNELGDKLAMTYITGKAKVNSRRKRRAIGSVSATIVNITAANGSSSFADVTFFIFDSGKVANATYATAVMNRLTTNEMSLITSPYAIITSPRPVVVPKVTETPPATIAPVVIPYWIIGAVLGPIFLIIIIILLIYWRWRSGAPQSKVQPAVQKTPEYLRKTNMQRMQTQDEVRYAENKPPMSKIANMSAVVDRSYENLPKRETSLRRKVAKTSMQKRADMSSRTNAAYEESEEDEDYDNSFITMSSTSQSRVNTTQPESTMKDRQTIRVPVRSTPRKTPQKILEEETETGSSESEAESIATTRTDQTKFSAAQVPTVAVMGGSSSNQPQVPVRFRSSVHPVSSLPPIYNKHTSLVAPPTDDQEDETPRKTKRRSKAAQQELKQKADMERLRNKKRQRERKNKVTPIKARERTAWARDELEQVLDPRPLDPFSRSKRRKPQRSRRADSVATDEDAIELKSYKQHPSPEDSIKQPPKDEDQMEDQSGESSDESSISMEETRKRMHTLLDDAFSLLGPLSQKQKQRPTTLQGPGDYYNRPPAPARFAGSTPALPEPAPAHGRASEPTPRQRRRLGNTGGFPHGLPQTPIGPGYPVRPPMRPPLVTNDPVVVWDPYDRQRYINQRMGFPHQGGPNPTYTYTDPHGQNVYITPVQQQRDYMGGPIWSPYTAEDTMEDLYPDLAKSNYPGALGTSPPKDPGYRDVNSRDTVIDMNDQYGQRGNGLGQAPQPLIRSIKDELLRLSNGGARRTPITEL